MNINKACHKAIDLCKYMLDNQEDSFVKEERTLIRRLQEEGNYEEAANTALEVSRYIRDNFDNVIGENVVMDIENLLEVRV